MGVEFPTKEKIQEMRTLQESIYGLVKDAKIPEYMESMRKLNSFRDLITDPSNLRAANRASFEEAIEFMKDYIKFTDFVLKTVNEEIPDFLFLDWIESRKDTVAIVEGMERYFKEVLIDGKVMIKAGNKVYFTERED